MNQHGDRYYFWSEHFGQWIGTWTSIPKHHKDDLVLVVDRFGLGSIQDGSGILSRWSMQDGTPVPWRIRVKTVEKWVSGSFERLPEGRIAHENEFVVIKNDGSRWRQRNRTILGPGIDCPVESVELLFEVPTRKQRKQI